MTKPPKPKSKSTKKSAKRTTNRQKWLNLLKVVIAVVVLFFAGRTAYNFVRTQITYRQDKERFAETEKDMQSAYNAIVAKVGKPYETKVSKGCSYGALKFQRGPLSCGIGYNLVFGAENPNLARSTVLDVFDTTNGMFGFREAEYTIPSDRDKITNSFTAYFDNRNNMSCSIDYNLWSKEKFNNVIGPAEASRSINTSPYVILYSFGCNRDTPKAVYAIDNTPE